MKFFQASIFIKSLLILVLPVWVEAAEFHVSKSWELAIALNIAANNGSDDTIYLSVGTYSGAFYEDSYEKNSLTIKAKDGLTADDVILDECFLHLRSSKNPNFSLQNMTFKKTYLNILTKGKVIIMQNTFIGRQDIIPYQISRSDELIIENNIFFEIIHTFLFELRRVNNFKIKNNVFHNNKIISFFKCNEAPQKVGNIRNNTFSKIKCDSLLECCSYSDSSVFFYNNIIDAVNFSDNKIDKETVFYNDNGNNRIINNIYFGFQDNTPLFINPENNDFHLKPTSPCIDAGTNENVPYTETDIEGNPRIANGTVDLGAYEFTTNTPHPADTNENWVIESEEFTTYNTAWKNANTWPTLPNQIPAEYVTRSGFLLKKGGHYKNVGLPKPLCWMPDN